MIRIKEIGLLKRAIKEEKDEAVKGVLIMSLRALRMRVLGLVLNSLSIVLIIVGFVFWDFMGFWLTDIHGALTGIFLLGTVQMIRSIILQRKHAANNR